MRQKKLINKTLLQFAICVLVLLVLSTPLFYWLTRQYYAEDLIMVTNMMREGKSVPALDMEEDIMHGIMIQFALTVTIIGVAAIVVMKFISSKLWRPFNDTLGQIDKFRVEDGSVPALPQTGIKEFTALNDTLTRLMMNSTKSYKTQKEFTENASHELQTPLAVFQSKLDILLQEQNMTQHQAETLQSLYQVVARLTHLNKNLLLLARIDNSQYESTETISLVGFMGDLLPMLRTVSGSIAIKEEFAQKNLTVRANRTLLESLINNLVINAVRHNKDDGEIVITVKNNMLTVSNTSDEPALEPNMIFNRFYHPAGQAKGNGLGLAIVKAVCDYHGWGIFYKYQSGRHFFTVTF